VRLSNHLAQVHELSQEERKPYLQEAKLQKYKVIRDYDSSKANWLIPSSKYGFK
jgi:hypothetical protein